MARVSAWANRRSTNPKILTAPAASRTVCWVTTDEIIEEIGTRLAAAVPARTKVVLFGSRARGDEVLVVVRVVVDGLGESVRLRKALRGLGVAIDVIVMDAATVERRVVVEGTMPERALREGRVLIDA